MEFRILGPLEVVDAGRPVRWAASKQRTLLALLLLTPNRPVSVDRLIDALWSDDPPAAASNALQFHVSQLRKVLGDGASIVTQEPGYLIRIDPDQLDLLRFERLVGEAERAEDRPSASRLLGEALGLWRGEALAELADDTLSQPEAQRLEAARLAALELRIDADLALGRHAQLVPELEALVRDASAPRGSRAARSCGPCTEPGGRPRRSTCIARRGRRSTPSSGSSRRRSSGSSSARSCNRTPSWHSSSLRAGACAPSSFSSETRAGSPDLLAIAEALAAGSGRELILVRFAAGAERARGCDGLARRAARSARGSGSPMPRRRVHRRRGRCGGGGARDRAGRGHRSRGSAAGASRRRRARRAVLVAARARAVRRRSSHRRDGSGRRPGGDAVRRSRARLVGDRARRLARVGARHDTPPARHRSRPGARAARRQQAAGARLAARAADRRDRHGTAPDRAGRRRLWSRRQRTRACSWSASPTAGRRRGSAPSAPRSRTLRRPPSCSFAPGSALAASRRRRR